MATMKQNTSALDALLQKIDALPEKGGDAVLVALDVTPSESTQKVTPEAGTDGYNEVNVAAIGSGYVGSGVPRKASADLTVNGATVNVPAGYYAAAASKEVASGSEGTPVAEKSAVSGNQVTITPKVTNGAGYITGGAKTGLPVIVKAADLVSGSQTITENGEHDVTNLQQILVDVASSGGLPAGTSAIDFGTFDLASAVSGSATFNVPHKLGAAPDMFLFWSPANIATTYSELAVMRAADFGWRGGTYLNKCWFHGNSTSTVTGADATTSYGIKTMGASSVTICAHSTSSYVWRAGTYKYLAIKF